MSSRPIAAAVAPEEDIEASSPPEQQRAPQGPMSSSILLKRRKRPPRDESVAQACVNCRKRKIRCDGGRPSCGLCSEKCTPCRYEGTPAQTRQAANKARLDTFEELFKVLQSTSSSDAQSLLEDIRATNDLQSVIENHSRKMEDVKVSIEQSSSDASPMSRSRGSTSFTSPDIGSPYTSKIDSTDSTAPVIYHGLLPPPASSQIQELIDGYYSCAGILFHIFTREQVQEHHEAAFGPPGDTAILGACCIAAIAAVGGQYIFESDQADLQPFYAIAKANLERVLDINELEAVKVCALIALFHVLRKSTVALAYTDLGLCVAKRIGLDRMTNHPNYSDESWTCYRKVWRTLNFMINWMSFSLGYMPSQLAAVPSVWQKHETVRTPLIVNMQSAQVRNEGSHEPEETVQIQMANIAMIQSRILRACYDASDSEQQSIYSIWDHLEQFSDNLPESMRLDSLQDKTLSIRRAVYYVHLLYLGARILLFRTLASTKIQEDETGRQRLARLQVLDASVLARCEEEGLLAANHTARLLSLLMEEGGVFRRDWLIIYQTYCACITLLYSVIERQLRRETPLAWAEEIDNAFQCLTVLDYCGQLDHVARRFHASLIGLYRAALNHQADTTQAPQFASASASVAGPSSSTDPAFLLSSSELDSTQIRKALAVLTMLCRPFSGASTIASVDTTKELLSTDTPFSLTGLGWNSHLRYSGVQWGKEDLGLQGMPEVLTGMPSAKGFLDSSNPHGWSR